MKQIYTDIEKRNLLNLSDEERIAYIHRVRWIDYPIAKKIFEKFEKLLKYEAGKSRISSILLVGASSNGKTTLLERFIEMHPSYDFTVDKPQFIDEAFFETYSGAGIPVLYAMAPAEPNEARLYVNILNSLNVPYKEKDTVYRKQQLVEYYLGLLQVKMLIIDEIHNILSGSVARQLQVLNAIKGLSNTLRIPIVLAGTKDALRAMTSSDQIGSRFRPEYLTKWKKDQDTVNLIATALNALPLKKESKVFNDKSFETILELSNGYIGDIVGLLNAAGDYAIRSGSERITLKEIMECDYNSLQNAKKTVDLKDI